VNKLFVHRLLKWAIKDDEPGYEALSVNNLLTDGARKNDKRAAWMRVHCPDNWVLNIGGDEKLRDVYLLLRVPREVVDQWSAAEIGPDPGLEPLAEETASPAVPEEGTTPV
jgi:hypothetical protein